MDLQRLRVPLLALASLGLIVAGTLVLDWFVIKLPMPGIEGTAGVDLRSVHACTTAGVCTSMPVPRGLYPTFAAITLWTSLGFALVVAFQAGRRILTETANESLTTTGYFVGLLVLALAAMSAYLFGPDVGSLEIPSLKLTMTIERTFAPALLMLGDVLGIVTLYYAITYDAPSLPSATVVTREPSSPRHPTSDSAPKPPQSVPIPVPLRGKLQFAMLSAELTRAGVDARREDGSSVLVMWRDVVGVVARRLPAELEGCTFVDLVSSAGSTLRLLPWTRLSGDPLAGGEEPDGELRARAFVELVIARCPDTKLDPATRAFTTSSDPAAQLPDRETLATHDDRLA